MKSAILQALIKLEKARLANIAMCIGVEMGNAFTRAINELVTEKLISRDGLHVYRPTREGIAKFKGVVIEAPKPKKKKPKAMPKARKPEVLVLDKSKLKEELAVVNSAKTATSDDKINSVLRSIGEVESKLAAPLPICISEKELKIAVVRRLSEIMKDDISEVLDSIAEDLTSIDEVTSDREGVA
jgi:hypothetical protein